MLIPLWPFFLAITGLFQEFCGFVSDYFVDCIFSYCLISNLLLSYLCMWVLSVTCILLRTLIFWQIPDETVLTVNFFRLANLLYMLSILLSLFPNVVILKLLQWTYTVKLELFSKGTFHCIVVWVVWVAGVVFTLWLT